MLANIVPEHAEGNCSKYGITVYLDYTGKVNDVVKAKITDIDFDKKRVSLSIRALLEPEEVSTESAESSESAE